VSQPAAGRLARLQSATPLLIVYFGLAALYAWQASRHPVPTIFYDELEITELARSIADTGEPARRGVPYPGTASLLAYFLAPAWWLSSASAAYATAKVLLVLCMTATIFPAYALARLVVSRWWALAAAAGATAVPALAYSSILVEEPLAYPLSTLALWLIARVLVAPGWVGLGLAVVASGAAAWARTQLSVLFAVLALGLLWLAWDSETGRRWRASWSRWDWAGAVVIAIGVVLAFSAVMGHLSASWRETTFKFKERIFDHAAWSTGALAIGIGVFPLLAGIAALVRPRGERHDRETSAFTVVGLVSLLAFVWYAGIKGAYLSTQYGTVVVERNLIYLCPILFAATALGFTRGFGRWWAIAVGAVVTVYAVAAVPLRLDQFPYYDAHGLAAGSFLNRVLEWPEGLIEAALLVVCFLALAAVVALRVLRSDSRAYRTIVATTGIAVLAWTLTTEVYAAQGERHLSTQVEKNLAKPFDWVDRATDGSSVVVLGQAISDPTGVQLTEFFNRSVKLVWSLDGSAIKVGGPILTPDLQADDGTLTPTPGTEYVLALNGVELQAPLVDSRGNDRLYRVGGGPLKLAAAITGQESDGWLVGSSEERVARGSYNRYDVSEDAPGFVVVKLSRLGWCPKPPRGALATVRIGRVGIGPDKQPAITNVTDTQTKRVRDCTTTPFLFVPPNGPWRLEVTIAPTVSPREVDPSKSENRQLGATMSVELQPITG
jgi:hypothetical protein